MYLAHLDTTGTGVGNLKRLVIGGSAVPAPDGRRRGFRERPPADEAGSHAIWHRTAHYRRRWHVAPLGRWAGGCAPGPRSGCRRSLVTRSEESGVGKVGGRRDQYRG